MMQNIRKIALYSSVGLLAVMSLFLLWQRYTKSSTSFSVTAFAKSAALKFYTFDYSEDKKRFAEVKPYFTKADWQKYQDWFFNSDQFALVKDKNLSVKAYPMSEENTSRKVGKNSWEVVVPLNVVYSDTTHPIHSTHLQVVMTVQSQPWSLKHHFAVTRIAARTYSLS